MAQRSKLAVFLHSFAGRIILGGVIIHLLLIPFLFSGVLFIVAEGYKEQFTNHVRHDAQQLAERLSEQTDAEQIRAQLDDAVFSGRLAYADVVFETGDAVTSVAKNPGEAFNEDFYFGEHANTLYFIAAPFYNPSLKNTAILRLGYDETATRTQIYQAYQRGVLLAVGYVALSLLLVAVVTPQLTRPLRQLRDAAQRIADNDTVGHLRVHSSIYEIAGLAEDLERMREKLVDNAEAVAVRERRIRAIMDNVVDGIVTIDARGNIESMNHAAEHIFGYSQADMIGENLNLLLGQPYICSIDPQEGEASGSIDEITRLATHETVGRHQDGHHFPMEMVVSELPRSEGLLYIGILRDITERKQAEAELKALQEDLERRVIKRTRELASLNRELEHQALHDGLTELPNRLLLQDRLRHAIVTAQRKNTPLALLITDLDRFKEINDTLGHHYGDLVLQQVAQRMRGALRESDTIARLGGDEFAVLLPGIENEADAVAAARKLITALEQPIILEDQSFHVGASVGIALCPEHGEDGATLMRHADVAMYVAKRANAGFALYDPKEDQHSVSRLSLVGELRHAIEFKQLVLFYQPKIDLKTGLVSAVEAVVRWDHPQRGLLLPDEFIPLAEHTGLIRPLTFFVLDEALHQIHLWQKAGLELRMAINLSARHLQDEQLAGKIAAAMRQWGVAPQLLEFEITESAIMANPLRAMDTLTQLDVMGVGLSIDDFGTGYSSLIYLKQLPVDEIKIDKSFVIDMLDNNEDMVIVRSTVDLAHNMGRRVVAEGVENEAVLNTLIEMGCDMAQGYFISRPLTATALSRWLKESSWRLNEPNPQPATVDS
ncbi:MAG: EAL domain-containing protein [Pseudomonadota bacterium]